MLEREHVLYNPEIHETLNKDRNCLVNSLTTYVPHHIETSQLICNANHLTGFYMMGIIGG